MILFRHSFNGHTRGAAGRELQSGSTEGVGGRRGGEKQVVSCSRTPRNTDLLGPQMGQIWWVSVSFNALIFLSCDLTLGSISHHSHVEHKNNFSSLCPVIFGWTHWPQLSHWLPWHIKTDCLFNVIAFCCCCFLYHWAAFVLVSLGVNFFQSKAVFNAKYWQSCFQTKKTWM